MARPLRLKVGFWIDAGPATGGGHARRALALTRSLDGRGHHWLIAAEDGVSVVRATDGALHAGATRPGAPAARGCDVWVVDRAHTHPASAAALASLRARSAALVCFDANDATGRWCDLHVSAAPPNVAGDPSRCLWGPRYAVVAPPAPPQRRRDGLVFAFGASDPAGLSEAALALDDRFGSRRRRLIAGPLMGPARRAALRARAEARGVAFIDAPPDVSPHFAAAEVAVVPYGQMLLEALAAGCAVAMWHPSPEHAEVGRRFAAQCRPWPCLEIGWGDGPAVRARATETVTTLFDTPRRGPPPVDAQGADRIVAALERAVHHSARRPAAARVFDTTEVG